MSKETIVRVPDIGGTDNVEVIEIFVQAGDEISKDDSIITLESEKSTMEVPAPSGGKVGKLLIAIGDKVSEGDDILTLVAEASAAQTQDDEPEAQVSDQETTADEASEEAAPAESGQAVSQDVVVPDIGESQEVMVIEVMIKAGDKVSKDDSLITLESDKATMEIPAPASGEIESVAVKVGDKVDEGVLIAKLLAAEATDTKKADKKTTPAPEPSKKAEKPARAAATKTAAPVASSAHVAANRDVVYAGPAIRRLANELGVDLTQVNGSGRKGRIVKHDVHQFVKQRMQGGGAQGGFSLPTPPAVDFSKYGPIKTEPLSKIKRLTGDNVHRSWLTVPHVTQFDEADITELEAFRQETKPKAEAKGIKLTPTVFVMKAVAACLKQFPTFNASLDPSGENLILKDYIHIGIAVDTPNGLVVPVVRDVDEKGFMALAEELGTIGEKARDKKLMPNEMQGSSFTISSLGGISGTAFTPIVNTPDVAILGVSRSAMKPVYQGGEFVPRLMLPLSLSYDHRVIDGAEAARFTKRLGQLLADIRRILL